MQDEYVNNIQTHMDFSAHTTAIHLIITYELGVFTGRLTWLYILNIYILFLFFFRRFTFRFWIQKKPFIVMEDHGVERFVQLSQL